MLDPSSLISRQLRYPLVEPVPEQLPLSITDWVAPTGASEVWQARIGRDFAEQLRADADVLGPDGRTDIVKAALGLLHMRASEERMAQSVDEFYGESALRSFSGRWCRRSAHAGCRRDRRAGSPHRWRARSPSAG